MKSKLLIAVLLLNACNAAAQKNLLDKSRVNESFIARITTTCKDDAKKWSCKDGVAIRHYDNGYDYTLIDTAGLYIYIKSDRQAFFSKDACGEIYRLNYTSLKKSFRDNDDFVKALKKEKDETLSLPASSGNTTIVNALYREYVQSQEPEE